jgi:hypothetical protein
MALGFVNQSRLESIDAAAERTHASRAWTCMVAHEEKSAIAGSSRWGDVGSRVTSSMGSTQRTGTLWGTVLGVHKQEVDGLSSCGAVEVKEDGSNRVFHNQKLVGCE